MFEDNIIDTIADKHFKHFESELFEFLFCYKTEDTRACGKTILEHAEAVMIAAANTTEQDYFDEKDVDYDSIFQPATDICDAVMTNMIRRIHFPEGTL